MTKTVFRIFIITLFLYMSIEALSQEGVLSPVSGSNNAEKVKLQSWVKELRQKDNAAILFGNVEVSKGKLKILADSVVVWFSKDGSGVSDLYAEGNILLTDGKDKISAQALYYDFESGGALVREAWVQTTQKALGDLTSFQVQKESGKETKDPLPEIGLYFRAKKLRTERPTRYIGEDLTLSTCENFEPHWGVHSREGTIYPGGTFEAKGNSLFLGPVKIPFFNVRFEPDWRMPLYRIRTGSSEDKGGFTLTRWQLLVEPNYKFFCDLDFYHKKGTGRGAVLEHTNRALPWTGYLETYVINDKAPPVNADTYRYRLKGLELLALPGDIDMAFEYSKTSDETFLLEFFEREYKKGRKQETYAYLRKTHRNLGARLFGSVRTEDFKTETLYQPRVSADAISRELPGGFYFTASTRNEKILKRHAEVLTLADIELERHDALFKLDRPLTAGRYLTLKPGIDARYTHYNINLNDSQNIDREVVKASLSADSRISRNYRFTSIPLDINGLKHSIEPQVRYENTYHNDTKPAKLYQLDELDTIRKGEILTLSVTNRLSTFRTKEEKKEIANLLDWRIEIPYYSKPHRDNSGESYGPLESRLELSATPFLTIRSDLQYDTKARHMKKGSFNITAANPGVWNTYLGMIYASGKDTIGTAGLSARLSPKWSASARVQHNLSIGRYVSKTFTLTRKFHCWIMELGVVVERDKDTPTYTFLISPAALFKKETLHITEETTFLK